MKERNSVSTLEALRAAEFVSWLDWHFARTVTRLANDTRPEVALAAAMVSRAVREGHVCLDLGSLTRERRLRSADGETIAERPWPALPAWLDALRASALVGDGSGDTPLVLDDAGRLYLRRYWQHERQLAECLRARATQVDTDVDGPWLSGKLDDLFKGNSAKAGEIDWQRIATLVAALRRFCVISGGPGTGKTYTVVKVLALLVELELHRGRRPPRITLVAPTGKAAARLAESINTAKVTLAADDAVKAAIPAQASTIHRCLGSVGGSSTLFRHNADNPLVTDVVLVDEASMVDVGLMTRLVTAMPEHARLILLGDKDQLASVEAGAVLGDICNAGGRIGHSHALIAQIESLTGERLPLSPSAPQQTGIWDCIVELTHSHRYDPKSGIGALARAINAGEAGNALEILAGADASVARAEPGPDWEMSDILGAAVKAGFAPYLEAKGAEAQLSAMGRFRVLCAHRRGVGGVETLNRQVEEALGEAGLLVPEGLVYTGRPVMVTENDYQVKLFNGDVGLLVRDPERPESRLVAFLGEQGQPRLLAPSRLPPHETVFAMSIHKSQGSEFDEVAVVLPPKPSPVLSRELLYTAVTRAKKKIVIHAGQEVVRAAIERRVERSSGLREQLWGKTAGDS